MGMFCYQCEQTAKSSGCTAFGVCGKDPETSALQDLLMYAVKGISMYAHRARSLGALDADIDVFTLEALFSTVTNVNFDPARMDMLIRKASIMKDKARSMYKQACQAKGAAMQSLDGPAAWEPGESLSALVRQGVEVSIESRINSLGNDITGLQELLTYGLKGMAAYADHAFILGKQDPEVFAFIYESLDYLTRPSQTLEELLSLVLRCGEVNLKVMGLLDAANTGAYGQPVPAKVRITPLKGKAILISGHDLKDLEELLKQTEGTGINIYTHGEMLPAHGYPELKKYSHLAGNYGGAWQDQQKEFDAFPGAILMTTNCIQKPRQSYMHRIFTSGLVAWQGVAHIASRDFTPLINAAEAEAGFAADGPESFITVGFAQNAVVSVADKVIAAVKEGAIKHFFFIGGCDGAKTGRNYYSDFASAVPKDCVILTAGCGKYRFNKEDFGDIGGIPRLLDCGQCNDSYSAIQIAAALAQAFNCSVNDLPLSLIVSWYEQKAVCVLLSLLYLGVKNIRLGPTLPAFVSPAAFEILQDKFNLMPIGTVEQDLKNCLAGH